jgi:putative flippase GtrA
VRDLRSPFFTARCLGPAARSCCPAGTRRKMGGPLIQANTIGQMGRFGIIGACATTIHYITAISLAVYVSALIANLGGFAAAVGLSYVGHHHWTFNVESSRSEHMRRLGRFVVVGLIALALSQAILAVSVLRFSLPSWLAIGAAVSVVPMLTFVLNRQWVFRRSAG